MSVVVRSHPSLGEARFATLALEELVVDARRLHEAERRIFEAMVATERRKREWFAGRIAAHAALRSLGYEDVAVLRRDGGAPQLVGPRSERLHVAITHGKRLAAAVVADADGAWPHVGIDVVDAEDGARIDNIARRVLTPDELARAAKNPLHATLAWGAREAVAKATSTGMFVFALSQCWTVSVDEDEREVTTNLDGVRVVYDPLPDGGVLLLAGAARHALEHAQRAALG